MDDKQLYKLMEDYLNTSLKGDKDRDLSKFNKVELKRKTSFFKSKLFYAALSCVMILVISFSVLLPFLFKNKNGGTEIRYYDDIEIEYVQNISYNELFKNFDSNVLTPKVMGIEYINKYIYVKDSNDFIGVNSDIYVYDENFDLISFYTLNKNTKLSFLEQHVFNNTSSWQDLNIRWEVTQSFEVYKYIFTFEKDNYYYFYTVETINSFEINNLLEILFV